MNTYDVEIKATVRKTYRVEAESEEFAVEAAHQVFSVLNDDTPEEYDQEDLSVELVVPADE